jgi:hypothetical protein
LDTKLPPPLWFHQAMTAVVRVIAVAAVLVMALAAGTQLRASREQPAAGQAAASSSPMATAIATPQLPATAAPTPSPGGVPSVTGRVTAGGRPVRGAEIRAYPANAGSNGPTPVPPESGKAITDETGAYRVGLPLGTFRIGAFLAGAAPELADGYWFAAWVGDVHAIGLSRDVVVTGSVAGVDIAMIRTVKLGGRVVGRDGVGVPNAELRASLKAGTIEYPIGAVPKSDASGAFSARVVPVQLQLYATAAGRTQTVFGVADLDLNADRTDIILTMDRGNVVTGVLRDAQGKPMVNMNFGVHPTDAQVTCDYSCNATTDAAGHFAVTVPSATVYFATWRDDPGTPLYRSKEIVVSSDLTVDPVLVVQ